MTAPTPQRAASAEERDRLREALARHFDASAFLSAHYDGNYWAIRRADAYRRAAALLSGPLALLLDRITAAEARAEEAKKALTKIDAIRNSIIGFHKVNWSEHVYPLVAALAAAGFEGMDYDEASANAGTLLDQIKVAEADRDRLADEVALLRAALKPFAAACDDDPRWSDAHSTGVVITFGSFRAAARALTATGGTTDA